MTNNVMLADLAWRTLGSREQWLSGCGTANKAIDTCGLPELEAQNKARTVADFGRSVILEPSRAPPRGRGSSIPTPVSDPGGKGLLLSPRA